MPRMNNSPVNHDLKGATDGMLRQGDVKVKATGKMTNLQGASLSLKGLKGESLENLPAQDIKLKNTWNTLQFDGKRKKHGRSEPEPEEEPEEPEEPEQDTKRMKFFAERVADALAAPGPYQAPEASTSSEISLVTTVAKLLKEPESEKAQGGGAAEEENERFGGAHPKEREALFGAASAGKRLPPSYGDESPLSGVGGGVFNY